MKFLGILVASIFLSWAHPHHKHHHHHHKHHHKHKFHLSYKSEPGKARYWANKYFGKYGYASLVLCFAKDESQYELSVQHHNTDGSVDSGPWQINNKAHSWVKVWRIRRSWRYAAAVTWRLATYTDTSGLHFTFHAWNHPDCGSYT